jgi:hypothetical protein
MPKKTAFARNQRGSGAPATIVEELRAALEPTVAALQRLARCRMEPALARRMHELGERKEFLGKKEHAELLQLVAFWRQRTLEKLQARLALERLRRVVPKLRNNP